MEYYTFKRGLVFSIITLFVGASVIPSISGDIEKISNVLEGEVPEIFSMRGDGLLAYWSFDEGSGGIAHDYSGHDYHGVINGASWTTGHSSYALDFDGVNDYVTIDSYSEKLGFNKTDDYKISVWINSTSISGMIYEISDESDFTPSAYIKLNSDGNLETKVQSTETCDVEVISDDSYNDGLWHYVECIYHGASSPTLDLYVDEELVGSNTDWLCGMFANQFNKAKIGRSSYDLTEHFDGIIDEVKVYKKPEGNQPPNAPDISGPTSGIIGEEYSYIFISTDPDVENVSYWIDWGDNNTTGWIGPYSSNEEINVSHTWYENGVYEIRAKAKDVFDVSEWSTLLIVIENLAPDAPSITGPTSGNAGTPYPYTFTSTDPDGDQVSYYIQWGDGTTPWTAFQASGPPGYSESHTWSTQGTYVIKAKAKDTYGAEGPEGTLTVTMPRNRVINIPFLNFLQQLPNLFPILQKMLLQRLGLQ